MTRRDGSIDTQLIHAGEIRPGIEGAVALPIFQSANFESVEGEEYHDIKYMRLSNSPNHVVLGDKLAALEGAETGLVLATGMEPSVAKSDFPVDIVINREGFIEAGRADGGVFADVLLLARAAGHRLPTGYIDRQLILVVEAFDADGQRLAPTSGPQLPPPVGSTSSRCWRT